ncbi:MAG: sulfite exporter TauE/SafE family protein [Clostridiaceae bacterium]|nr:sulfite exporter TauE/SafE family protein [Clostridiaceae bacterium]
MNYGLTDFLVLLACSVISSMGLGGGGLLILYLIGIRGISQLTAQGINLFFFIPCSVFSVIIYIKNGLVKPKKLLPMLAGSALGALGGSLIVNRIGADALKTLFAFFLIVSGTALLFSKGKSGNK